MDEEIHKELQALRKDFVTHTEEDKKIAQKMFEYHKNLDHHLSSNGVEAKRLTASIDAMQAKINEMYEPYRDAQGVARSIKWGVGLLLGIASVVGAIKYLIKL